MRPAALLALPFMKNDTVIGTMGNTHGVSSAAKPQSMASITSIQSNGAELFTGAASVSAAATVAADVSPTSIEKSHVSGIPHSVPRHDIQETVPFTVALPPAGRTFWPITILS